MRNVVIGVQYASIAEGSIPGAVLAVVKDSKLVYLKERAQDPLGRVMNWENSGNSGLFSIAEDLALLAAALMNGGKINGVSVLGKLTVDAMTTVPKGPCMQRRWCCGY